MAELNVGLLEMFPDCAKIADTCGGLDTAVVTDTLVDRERLELELSVRFARAPSPAELDILGSTIRTSFGLSKVNIISSYPKRGSVDKPAAAGVKTIYGKITKAKPTPMRDLTPDSGNVTVEGVIFAVNNRDLQKRGAKVLSFDMTDYTGSIRVNKYLAEGEDMSIVGKVSEGLRVAVSGRITFTKFEGEMVLEPKGIGETKETVRPDDAPEKRVELHLHTRFSAMDALTDPEALVKRAADWGHRAVAVTDHGVAQAYPDMWKAAKNYAKKHDGKSIKIIYGIEGYYVNDAEVKKAVWGKRTNAALTDEFVAFDVETTGLNAQTDRLTEIGAVIFRGANRIAEFDTFVNPGIPIPPEITALTSITDRDVFDAPYEAEAIAKFLEFAGDRPLVAHNASFDIGFITEAANRSGIDFDPVVADTLYMSQCLLPELKRHKLDGVARHLGLPDFKHHRANDDAAVCGRIMERFVTTLRSRGVEKLSEVNDALSELKTPESRRVRHISILVQNKTGLKNLYQLISSSYLEHYKKSPVIPRTSLEKHREGLLIGSACEAGELYQAVVRGASDAELRKIADFYDYLEIMPLCNNRFMVDNGTVRSDEALKELNLRVARLAEETGKLLVATGDVHFLDERDEIYRKILLTAKKFSDASRDMPLYFRNTGEMLAEFDYLDDKTRYDAVIANPNKIADMCEDIKLLPSGLFPPKIENSEQQLKDLVYGRMREIYGDTPPELVTKRIETELGDILGRHYDVIYMSAQKLVADSNAHGYLVGSRGSVGSSLVAYMSGITEVNSLPPHYVCPKCKHTDFESAKDFGCGADLPDMLCPVCGEKYKKEGFDIPFETFLGFGGDKVPDIDLNFSGEYQAKAHKYTEELFGSDHVFRAGTIGTIAEKTGYGYVLNYLETNGITDMPNVEKSRLAVGLVGVKRTTGQHPGGLVVIPQDMDVEDFCPVQHPADDPESGIITTHFEYHCMEDNLLKLDELGHDDPTMLKMLQDMTGYLVHTVPLDDKETRLIFKSPTPLGIEDGDPIIGHTGTIGIPEFGTGFTRQMLVDTQPEQFDTLVRLSGYSHGTDVWLGNAKDLILEKNIPVNDTVGCRDDIMIYLIKMGMEEKRAFKIMETVRKKNKALSAEDEQAMRDLGVPEWYIESCRKIQYLFPKAHAVAYVMMAFRIAYFKVHYPLAFYSAYFYRRSQKDSFDAEMMTRGLDFVRRKINELKNRNDLTAKEEDLQTTLEAVYEFYMRGFSFAPMSLYESDEARFLIVGERELRPPFVALSGLGGAAAADLMAAKNSGREFISMEDLSRACPKVSQTNLDQLRRMGALGEMPEESQMTLF